MSKIHKSKQHLKATETRIEENESLSKEEKSLLFDFEDECSAKDFLTTEQNFT